MLPLFKVAMSSNLEDVISTLQSGMITQGKKVEEFETKLKDWFKHPYILTLNSATSGLSLALRLLNLPIGSEVLCTPLTCFATTCAVLENRLSIKWVDVDPKTCNMDLDDLRRKISPNTKAIVFVHWAGSPIDLDRLHRIAGEIPIVEDCAHAFGAEYDGKKLGTHGNMAVYSLQAIKHLTTGDGGLIFLPNQQLYERAKLLRWYGISREKKPKGNDFRMEENITEWGYKFHMNDVNATIGLCNLPLAIENLKTHRDNALYYTKELADLPGIQLLEQVPRSNSAFWLYTLKVQDKDSFMSFMNKKNITVSQVHNRNDIHSCVSEFSSHLPNMDSLEKELISIPVGWWITKENREYIVSCIKEWSKLPIIRLLRKTDKNEYLALLEQLNGHVCDPYKFDTAFAALDSSISDVYVLIVNGEMVATAKVIYEIKFSDNVAHIEDVVCAKQHRKKGYASQLIQHIIEKTRPLNCYKIVLNANEDIVPLYLKNGFSKKGSEMCLYLQ